MAVTTVKKYLEKIESVSPTTHSWSVDGGSAQATFIIDWYDFANFITEILGGVFYDSNNYMKRIIPLSLPEFPWLYASRVVSMQGLGQDGRTNSESFAAFDAFAQLDKTVLPYAGVYAKYRIVVEFTTRPYRILTDEQISSWGFPTKPQYFLSATNPVTVVNSPFVDRWEYSRYCTWSEEPTSQLLTNNLGSFYYQTDGADATGPLNNQAISSAESGGSNLVQVKSIVKLKWWYVPYSTINNVYFHDAYNKVNSTTFFDALPGTLLFKNIEIEEYSNPVPLETLNYSTNPLTLTTAYLKNRYCDLTFVFERFDHPSDALGTLPNANFVNVNGKVLAGHNLLPYVGNNLYYYVENSTTPNIGLPPFWSYDMAQLFLYNPYINPPV